MNRKQPHLLPSDDPPEVFQESQNAFCRALCCALLMALAEKGYLNESQLRRARKHLGEDTL